jgi:PAS domain S-box-containing protein
VSTPGVPPEQSAEELFEEAPCGYLTTTPDGTILRVNRTFERWLGVRRGDVVGRRRFVDLLSPGSRIYHETHYAPLLRLQGEASEIALDFKRENGPPLPVLVNSIAVGEGKARRSGRRSSMRASADAMSASCWRHVARSTRSPADSRRAC